MACSNVDPLDCARTLIYDAASNVPFINILEGSGMAMTKCTECKKDVSTEAEACPSCGKKVKKKMGLVTKVALGFFAVMVLAAIGRSGKSGDAGSATAPAATERAVADEPALTVSAVDLFKAYDKNEVAADETYKGRTLIVSGKVESIDKDFMDNIVVHISTGQMFAAVMATMQDSQKSAAAALSKRQAITVSCRGGGKVLTSPALRDCVIQ